MKRILVIQTASIGDVILTTPVLEELHERYPSARLDILVKMGIDELLINHPFLNTIYIWNKGPGKYRHWFRLLNDIRRQRYDLVINVQRFFSTGLLTFLSGAAMRSGFDKNPFSFSYQHKVRHSIGEDGIHEAERNVSLIPLYDIDGRKPRIMLYPSPDDYQRIQIYQEKPYVCISPASLWYTKQFPAEKWIDFIRSLGQEYSLFLLGARADHALVEDILIATNHPSILNLAGQLTLLQSAALMEGALMNYVNDSAPLHLCSARKAPVTAVFCSTVPSFGFGPFGNNGRVVETTEKLDCRPCGLHGWKSCPEQHFLCALSIKTEQLLSTLPRL